MICAVVRQARSRWTS